MSRETQPSWQEPGIQTLRDPLAVAAAALKDFDFRLETLKTAAESLHRTAQSAQEASHDLVERCAKLLARILDVVIWSSDADQHTSFPGVEELAQFVRAATTTLRSALEERPGALQQVEDLTSEAMRRWGEWIDLLEDHDESSQARNSAALATSAGVPSRFIRVPSPTS